MQIMISIISTAPCQSKTVSGESARKAPAHNNSNKRDNLNTLQKMKK